MPNTPLPRWQRSDNFGIRQHQRVVDEVNAISNIGINGGRSIYRTPFGITVEDDEGPVFQEIRQGVITSQGPSSEADYANNRYWIKLARIIPATAETDLVDVEIFAPAVDPSSSLPEEPAIITATNRFEDGGSHVLQTDDSVWVEVFGYLDVEGFRRWVFYHSPSMIRFAKATATLAAPAISITATPCNPDGTALTPPASNITLNLTGNLSRGHYWLSSVTIGDVFAYTSQSGINIVVGGMPIVGTTGALGALAQNIGIDGSLGMDWLKSDAYGP